MADLKTVASFTDAMSAHITAGMLTDNGIPAGVFGENSSYVCLNSVNPIEVKVNPEDYDAARKWLNRIRKKPTFNRPCRQNR